MSGVSGGYLLLSDGAVGGAAVSCRRLFQGLRATGADAAWLCAANGGDADAESASEWPSVAAFLRRRIGSRFSGPTSEKAFHEANLLARVRKRAPRVLNLHNVHDAVRATFPARLPRAIPVVVARPVAAHRRLRLLLRMREVHPRLPAALPPRR